jgi:hypothetical protein
MEPQVLVDYLQDALGRSYQKGETILGIILAGMRKDPDCLTQRDCDHLVRSVKPFIKNPRDMEIVMTLLRGGRVPEVDGYRATMTNNNGAQGG